MEKNQNKVSNGIVLTLLFSGFLLAATTNMVLGRNDEKLKSESESEKYKNYEFISAKLVSDVNMKKNRESISYFVDVDLDNDGKKDMNITLVDNVKYVSNDRKEKLLKLKQGAKVIFEGNVNTHLNMVEKDVLVHGKKVKTSFPQIMVDEVSSNSIVGLIDNVVVVNGEIVSKAKKKNHREHLDYLDTVDKNSEPLEAKDGKIDDNAFKFFYESNIRER